MEKTHHSQGYKDSVPLKILVEKNQFMLKGILHSTLIFYPHHAMFRLLLCSEYCIVVDRAAKDPEFAKKAKEYLEKHQDQHLDKH